jgi:hypothetical protein
MSILRIARNVKVRLASTEGRTRMIFKGLVFGTGPLFFYSYFMAQVQPVPFFLSWVFELMVNF